LKKLHASPRRKDCFAQDCRIFQKKKTPRRAGGLLCYGILEFDSSFRSYHATLFDANTPLACLTRQGGGIACPAHARGEDLPERNAFYVNMLEGKMIAEFQAESREVLGKLAQDRRNAL